MTPCPYCSRRLSDEPSALVQHLKAKHRSATGFGAAMREAKAARDRMLGREESMADLFVQAEINRAAGVQNDPWIEEMLP